MKKVGCLLLLCICLSLALSGGIIFATVHFVTKYWWSRHGRRTAIVDKVVAQDYHNHVSRSSRPMSEDETGIGWGSGLFMSWEASAWAKKTRGHRSHGSGRLLLVLADYHSHQGGCWPSQKMLADDCEMPIRTVQWCLRSLETAEFITTLQKGNQYQPTRYQLNFNVAVAQGYEPARSEPANIAPALEPARSDMVNPQDGASEPATPRITNRQEPSIEPPTNIYPAWVEILKSIDGKEPTAKAIQNLKEWVEESKIPTTTVEQGLRDLKAEQSRRHYKDIARSARNWISNAHRWSQNGTVGKGRPSRPKGDRDTDELKAGWNRGESS